MNFRLADALLHSTRPTIHKRLTTGDLDRYASPDKRQAKSLPKLSNLEGENAPARPT